MIMLSHPETVADVILTAAAAVDCQPICGGEIADMSIFERVHIPSLGGATEWLNSEPLGPAGLTAWKGAK
jgi:hypothetical protein